MEFKEHYRSDWRNHAVQMPPKTHSKFFTTNQKNKDDFWEDPSNTDRRL
jgi:hypothetical protein